MQRWAWWSSRNYKLVTMNVLTNDEGLVLHSAETRSGEDGDIIIYVISGAEVERNHVLVRVKQIGRFWLKSLLPNPGENGIAHGPPPTVG